MGWCWGVGSCGWNIGPASGCRHGDVLVCTLETRAADGWESGTEDLGFQPGRLCCKSPLCALQPGRYRDFGEGFRGGDPGFLLYGDAASHAAGEQGVRDSK